MKKPRRDTFADIVRSEREQPTAAREPRLRPGRHDDVLVTGDRRRWRLAAEDIAPQVAADLVVRGAAVAHDPCGCGGTCGLEVLDPDTAAVLARSGPPSVSTDPRHPGTLSHWIGDADPAATLVLAAGRVLWGRELA